MANLQFGDSIENNLHLIEEVIKALPPGERGRAKMACGAFERIFADLRRDYPQSAGVALGSAFAVYSLAQRMIEQGREGDTGGLIQLL